MVLLLLLSSLHLEYYLLELALDYSSRENLKEEQVVMKKCMLKILKQMALATTTKIMSVIAQVMKKMRKNILKIQLS